MGKTTEIAWTDHTFNPWWGCLEVSPGCDHRYARTLARRFGKDVWGPPRTIMRMVTGDANWRQPLAWNRAAAQEGRRHRVFCASMADVFEFHPQLDAARVRLWALIEQTPQLDWLLLTKRPMSIARMLPAAWLEQPRPNVWLGTSVEDQERAELRIGHLLEVPAVVQLISAEPLLGPLDLEPWLDRLDWVISGGESGPHHRRFDIAWVREIDRQCRRQHVAHFFKQHGGLHPEDGGCLLDGRERKEFPTSRQEWAV
jgi:protein gp37